MKIVVYCQHVLGVGHLHRAIELCRAFTAHEVVLVTGGPLVDVKLPANVNQMQLPSLQLCYADKYIFFRQPALLWK